MKKICVLTAIFAFLLCSGLLLLNKKDAAAEPASISITALDKNGNAFDNTVFNNNVLSIDYADMDDNFKVTFRTNATSGAAQWKKDNVALSFQNEYELSLFKTTSNAEQLLLVGDSKYTFLLSNGADTMSVDVNVKITDKTSIRKLLFFSTLSIEEITHNSPAITLKALLPTTKPYTVTYFIKTPNSNEYIPQESTTANTFVFTPSTMINSNNGYGTYGFMASAVENVSNRDTLLHHSNAISYKAKLDSIDIADVTIEYTVIENTRARVEAGKFILAGIDDLDISLIQWYVGDNILCGVGAEFIYEPTNTDPYRVIAKYATSDQALTKLAEIKIEPQTTGTSLLILYVAGGIAIISIFFTISIIITNKRRDVAW